MYKSKDTLSSISAETYIGSFRDTDKFIVFCKQCASYGHCWSCPPFSFDTEAYLAGYENVIIIGTKITPNKGLSETDDMEKNKLIAREILFQERCRLDAALLELEKRYPNGKAFFAGVCHSCGKEKCSKTMGEPCRHPERTRPSLESLGFDVGRTAAELLGIELKWSSDGRLPEYLTLVSGFFTDFKPEEIEWKS